MPEPTVAASYPAALLEFAAARGADRTRLEERSALPVAMLEDPDNRVPLVHYLALLDAASESCNDPALGLHFGEAVPMHDISPVSNVTQYAPSASAGVDMLNRYARLTLDEGDGGATQRVVLLRERDDVWLSFTSPLYVEHPVLVESAFARCITGIRAMYATKNDGKRWPYPKAIHFTHAEPGYRAEYDRLFGAPITFESDKNAWLMDEAFVAFTQPKSTSYRAHTYQKHADTLLERLDAAQSARGQVERLLMATSGAGVGVEKIAGELALSRQTLLRRLKSEGTTFEEVRDQLRKKLALDYLTRQRYTVKQAAHELGFSDATAFSRAFKRWTGYSPRTYTLQKANR